MSTDRSRAEQLSRRATIGIITALPKEFSAAKVMLEGPADWSAQGSGAGRRYVLGEIPAAGSGTHTIALAPLPDIGTSSAAIRATNLLHHFPSIRHIILCGIAGGIPSHEDDIRLGDIVISDRIVSYDFIRHTPDEVQELHSPPPPGAELTEAVRILEARRIEFQRPWERFLERTHRLDGASRPQDNLGADGKPIAYPPNPLRQPGQPLLFYGPIASANRLLKDERFRDELRRRFKTKAVEMEGAGVADAAWASDAGYLVVRGISDFCDMRKGDRWQGYAAVAAAAYVRALLESMPVASATSDSSTTHTAPPSQQSPFSPSNHEAPAGHSSTNSHQPQKHPPLESSGRPRPRPHLAPDETATASSQSPATAPTTQRPVETTHPPPRRSAAGRVLAAFLFLAGAVGVITYQGKPRSASKDLQSKLEALVNGLKDPSPPSLLVPTTPPPNIHTSTEGLSGLRRFHHVRALQDSENGRTLGDLPSGVFGYIEPQALQSMQTARVYGNSTGGALEIHKLDDGSIMLVGFARDTDTHPISENRPAYLVLSRTASTQARTAVAIPLDWVRTFSLSNRGDMLLKFF